ncbi:MAG: 30S ribosome-binding factor RbfA [Alphaproteobacteria bacterium]|nr:MAG: 30S ribosome-binding factor RbfA [Alphaproteobacteria bacterium]
MKRRAPSSRTPPGQRQLRVGERIRHILAEVLSRGHLTDPVLVNANMITVTAVEIGPDLKHATAYVMPLGGKNAEAVVHALNRASGYFRAEVGHDLDLHSTPKISFRIDNSFENAAHIENLLRQDRVRKDVVAEDDEE